MRYYSGGGDSEGGRGGEWEKTGRLEGEREEGGEGEKTGKRENRKTRRQGDGKTGRREVGIVEVRDRLERISFMVNYSIFQDVLSCSQSCL
jgi:hypothetical protein